MVQCAFMERECNSECVAYVGSAKDFHFPCARLDSMYEIAWTLAKLREQVVSAPKIGV